MAFTASLTAIATIAIDRVCGTGPWPAASAEEMAVAFHSTTIFAAEPVAGAATARYVATVRTRAVLFITPSLGAYIRRLSRECRGIILEFPWKFDSAHSLCTRVRGSGEDR